MFKYIIHLALILGIISCSIKPLPSETSTEKNSRTLQEETVLYLAPQTYSKTEIIHNRLQVIERQISNLILQNDSSALNRTMFLKQLLATQSYKTLTLNIKNPFRTLKVFKLSKKSLNSQKKKPFNQSWTFFKHNKYNESFQLFRGWNELITTHLPEFLFWFGEAYFKTYNQRAFLDCFHKALTLKAFPKKKSHLKHAYLCKKQGLDYQTKNQIKKLRLLLPNSEYIKRT